MISCNQLRNQLSIRHGSSWTALLVLAGLWSLLCNQVSGVDESSPPDFRAGAYAIDITPTRLPVIVNGGMTEQRTSTVTDPLHARCLVLDDGRTKIAFAVVDSCVVPGDLMDRAKATVQQQTGIPVEHILIAATHSHSTPSVCSLLGSGQNDDYAEFLCERIAAGIQAADDRLVPARIGWGIGQDPHNVFCRRFVMKPGTAATNPFGGTANDVAQMNPGYQNPDALRRTGPVDPAVSVLSVQTRDGRPLAILANYSTHYAGAPGLSADYFGVFARRISELIGADTQDPPFVGIMSNGTSGDANCCDFVNPPRKFDYQTVGRDTAQAAFEAYQRITYVEWVSLSAAQRVLTLGVRKPSELEVQRARQVLQSMGDRRPESIPEVYAYETVVLREWPETQPVKLQALRIGSLGIAALPCEVYGSTGLAIKQDSPLQPTFNMELANGYNGYLPPADQFPLGGYTTWRARSSYLEVEAEAKIRAAVLELLHEVAVEPRS